MISSGGKARRALVILAGPLWALWIILAFIWGGQQGVLEVIDHLERWMKP